MKARLLAPTLFALALMQASLAWSAVQTFEVDPVHSEVGFTVRHIVAKVPGRFSSFKGSVSMDPAAIESTLKIQGQVDAASVDTGVEDRDKHLRSADFFDVEKHPQITFTSKKAAKKGDKYAVTGDLAMHGVTKEVTLDAEVLGVTTNPFSKMPSAGMELTGTINRKDFGINWNKALDTGGFILGDDVSIVIRLEANVPAAEPAKK
jgi:polyisoprenoid-binding protein YceI